MLDETVDARCDELGVSSRVQHAAESLSGLISSGLRVPAVVRALLARLERFAARDGKRVAHASSGARAAVRLLAQACAQQAGELREVLPALIRFCTAALSDCEESVRDAFAAALAAAVQYHAPTMAAEDAHGALIAPLIRSLSHQSNSRGGALALKAVLRSVPARHLQACAEPVTAALKRHLAAHKPGATTQPQVRALLLDCVATMLDASGLGLGLPEAVAALARVAIGCAHATDWRERLAAVSVLRSVPTLELPAHLRSQHAAALAKLRYDPSSLVRQSVSDARAESGRAAVAFGYERLALRAPPDAGHGGDGMRTASSPPDSRSPGGQRGGSSVDDGGVNWSAMVMACSAARWATAGAPASGGSCAGRAAAAERGAVGAAAGTGAAPAGRSSCAGGWQDELKRMLAAHEMAVYTGARRPCPLPAPPPPRLSGSATRRRGGSAHVICIHKHIYVYIYIYIYIYIIYIYIYILPRSRLDRRAHRAAAGRAARGLALQLGRAPHQPRAPACRSCAGAAALAGRDGTARSVGVAGAAAEPGEPQNMWRPRRVGSPAVGEPSPGQAEPPWLGLDGAWRRAPLADPDAGQQGAPRLRRRRAAAAQARARRS